MNSDCDDVGAVALLNSFMCQGEATLIAAVVNTRDQDLSSGAVVQAINAYYGHPTVPIGAYHGEPGPAAPITSVLAPPRPGVSWPTQPLRSHYTRKVHEQFVPDFPTDDKLPAGSTSIAKRSRPPPMVRS